MTSVPVMEKSAVQVKSFAGKGQKPSFPGFADSFSNVVNQSKELTSNQLQTNSQKKASAVQGDDKANKRFEKVETHAEGQVEEKGKLTGLSEQQEEDVISGKIEDVIKELADEFDVTEEELLSAMEILGLSLQDLTNLSDMAKLAANLLENIDSIALVTDESLFLKISALSSMVDEAVQQFETQFQLEPEQIEEIFIEVLKGQKQTEPEQTNMAEAVENTALNDAKEVLVSAEKPKDEQGQNKKSMESPAETESETQKTTLKVEVEQVVSRETKHEQSNNFQNSFGQNTEVFANKILAEAVKEPVLPPAIDPQSILEQIGEYVKISNKGSLSEMEMQLHPESLGNLHLNVSVKEGVVTAHFTAQNEMVKQAIETQVVQLKERLENQGVKIEAVEVTIASHEFERDLQNQNHEENEKAIKKVRRKINLNELTETEDELIESEDVKLQKDMMTKNGNTVDYMA